MRKSKLLFYALFFFVSLATAQDNQVTGHVSDESGKPLSGVSVAVKGTSSGTTTNENGDYKLTVPAGRRILVFSSIGYGDRELTIAAAKNVVLSLTTRNAYDSVVVVGYGTAKRSDVTGAVATVKSADLLAQPVTNALEGLQGRVAGVDVSLNSGAPGGLPTVIIRGIGSLNSSTDPLYVVDGVAMTNIQFLNPYDIQNIEVLKDASATSIYGARGSNGVILVTTKRGAANRGTVVSYDASLSRGKLAREMAALNSTEFLDVLRQGMANNAIWGAAPRTLNTTDTRLFKPDGSPLYNTDWQKETTRPTTSNSHQLSIQTRGENSSTGIFMGYAYNQGVMINSDLKRYNIKLAHDTKLASWVDFGANLLLNYSKENLVPPGTGGNSPTRVMIEMPSIFPVKFPDGTWVNNQVSGTLSYLDVAENPVKVLEQQTNQRSRTQLFGNTYFNFKITKDLEFKTQFGVDMQDGLYDFYSPSTLINTSATQKGIAQIQSEQYRYWQQENYLTYKKRIGGHSINAVVGASWQERTDRYLTGNTQFFADDYYRQFNLGAGAQPASPASYYNKWSINSYFARVGYTFNDKFLATLTERIDGSSRFGSANKYGYFPSVGLGYILSKEDFMKDSRVINYLKVRGSFGYTGNTEIGSYQSLATIGSGTTLINGTRAGSSSVNGLPNPNLKWEKNRQTDLGFEMQLFNSRISLEADYYYKLTTDLLLNKPIPTSTGFQGVLSNIGSLSNAGVDLAVTSRNFQHGNFTWSTTFVANYNKNKVVKLGTNNEDILPGPYWGPVSDGFTILRVGQAAGSFWGYKRLGTWSVADVTAAKAADPNFSKKPGEEKESATKQILGKGQPDWTGSLVNTFTYKNFDLMVDLQFSQGASVVQAFLFSAEDRTGYSNSLKSVLNAWTPSNQNTPIQQFRFAPDAGQSAAFDSHWVANGSFVRGRNVVLGYNLSQATLNALKIKRLRLYISSQNLFLIKSSSYQGYDPQSVSFSWNSQGAGAPGTGTGTPSTQGTPPFGQNIEFYQYPKARTFTLGLNVTF